MGSGRWSRGFWVDLRPALWKYEMRQQLENSLSIGYRPDLSAKKFQIVSHFLRAIQILLFSVHNYRLFWNDHHNFNHLLRIDQFAFLVVVF